MAGLAIYTPLAARIGPVQALAQAEGAPEQPALYEILAPLKLAILAPVFDGLFSAFCNTLGCPLSIGCGADLSP